MLLIGFLMGVIIAFEIGLVAQQFGAVIFVVDGVGVAPDVRPGLEHDDARGIGAKCRYRFALKGRVGQRGDGNDPSCGEQDQRREHPHRVLPVLADSSAITPARRTGSYIEGARLLSKTRPDARRPPGARATSVTG